ncbi:MAG: zf-HC2 domain-containing protein, partial [Candidatus Binatia bacterium]
MPPGRHCPHPGTISAYFERRLSESESRDFDRHVSSCSSCQKQLAALVRIDPSGPEIEPEPPGREPRWRWTWTASAALAATAVLAIVVTARFRPLMEEASRLAGETRRSKEQPESAVAPFPQPAPTAAADFAAKSAEPSPPTPMAPSASGEAETLSDHVVPPAPEAQAAPTQSMPSDATAPSGDRESAASPPPPSPVGRSLLKGRDEDRPQT